MFLLDNPLRQYAWGSKHAIAELLGREPSGEPEAELWVGAHPDSPSRIIRQDGSRNGLDEAIADDPEGLLGADTATRFGNRLPFLLKVLAAGSALSLQVHPDPGQAAAGFDAEEAAGVPRSAPHRTYRDRNHKPELLYTLSAFEALCGFRPPAEAVAVFAALAAAVDPGSEAHGFLDSVAARLVMGGKDALQSAFAQALHAPRGVVDAVVDAVEGMAASDPDSTPPPAGVLPGEGDDVARDLTTIRELAAQYPGDPGVLVALLLNRVSLRAGEALYLPAGNIHAYLSGLGIEVMASSDNVLRGGLTPKHVDPDALLATVVFEAAPPPTLAPEYTLFDQELYRPPFDEFQLQRIVLEDTSGESAAGPRADGDSHVPVMQNGPVVILAVSGPILLDTPRSTLLVPRGGSAFVGASEAPLIVRAAKDQHAAEGPVLAFAVTVGEEPQRAGA